MTRKYGTTIKLAEHGNERALKVSLTERQEIVTEPLILARCTQPRGHQAQALTAHASVQSLCPHTLIRDAQHPKPRDPG